MVTLTFLLWCKLKLSRDEFNNHHKFCKALGRLYVPCCKHHASHPCPGRSSGIKQNPSVSKSNRLHVVIFWIFLDQFEVYSMDSSKWWAIFQTSWTSTSCFSMSTALSVISGRFTSSSLHFTIATCHPRNREQKVKDKQTGYREVHEALLTLQFAVLGEFEVRAALHLEAGLIS